MLNQTHQKGFFSPKNAFLKAVAYLKNLSAWLKESNDVGLLVVHLETSKL